MDKKEVRKQIKDLKQMFSVQDKKNMSDSVWEQVEKNEYFRSADTVLAYWSMDDEVFTHDFVTRWSEKKTILLPRMKGDELEIRYFEGIDRLEQGGEFRIFEPVGAIFSDLNNIDIIIVPGVAFDKKNNRLGRGKGYYDKILKNTDAYKIGVCFDFQYLEGIPVDTHDVPMSAVIKSY